MHPHVAAVISRLDRTRVRLRRAVEAVPSELRGRRPGEGRWSVNDVLEHLSIVEAGFTKRTSEAITAATAAGIGQEDAVERAPLPETIETIVADREKKRTAPEAAHPRSNFDSDAAWQAVERSRRVLLDTLTEADGLALGQVFTSHPFFGKLTIYQMAELIAAHEARHTAQIEEVATELAPAS